MKKLETTVCLTLHLPHLSHLLFSALVVLLLAFIPQLSNAWELNVRSAILDWRYLYASQGGSGGFFGRFDVDNSKKPGDMAQLNGWFQRRTISGSTAAISQTRLVVFSEFKLNEAVSVHSTYQIGPYNAESERVEIDSDLETTIPDARWTRLWANVGTPFGRIYYGKRGFQQGCGLQFGSGRTAEEVLETSRRAEEILQLETFSGPFTLGVGFYPWRRGSERYWNAEDHNATRAAHLLGYLSYRAGEMDFGIGGFFWTFFQGPEAERNSKQRASAAPSTTSATEGWIYFKYNRGSFFFNAEADWFYRTIRYQASQDGTFFGSPAIIPGGGGSLFSPRFIESWRYMIEFGAFCGPAKLTMLFSHMPGQDRRHGILIFKQPFIQDADKSAYGVFYPYCLLMARYYRGGVNSYMDLSASTVFAGQLNYMLASNLDFVASVTHAVRASHGYGWGYIRPNSSSNMPARFGFLDFSERGSFQTPAPSIPDNDLGWEFNVGIMWRLLENWNLRIRGAHWRPGKWFNYACVDRSMPNWDNPTPDNNFGINPDRTIDAISGMEIRIETRL